MLIRKGTAFSYVSFSERFLSWNKKVKIIILHVGSLTRVKYRFFLVLRLASALFDEIF